MPVFAQRSFTSGELSPSLHSRVDLAKYATGLARCKNFIVKPQGGVDSRPGFRYIGEQDDMTKRARLIPFSFNTAQTYILVFEHLKMRVIKDGGYVLAGGGPSIYEIATPYTETELSRLSYTQSADVMTIVHPNHDPRNLSRTDHDNWTLSVIDYESSVEVPLTGVAIFQTSSSSFDIASITEAYPPVVTTTLPHTFSNGDLVLLNLNYEESRLSRHIFEIQNVTATTFELKDEDTTNDTLYGGFGTVFRPSAPISIVGSGGGSHTKYYSYRVTAVDNNGRESLPSIIVKIGPNSLTETYGVRFIWKRVPNTSYYRVYKSDGAYNDVYGWIGDTKIEVFEDYNIAPLTSDNPPEEKLTFSTLTSDIVNITQANPAVVTSINHGFSDGMIVRITNVIGMTEVNGRDFIISNSTNNTFELLGEDSTTHTAYSSGGIATFDDNKPSAVNYYQQRQIFANTNYQPQNVFTTETGNYSSLRTSKTTKSTDAITLTIASRQVNEIRHIISLDAMVLLTSGTEWLVTDGSDRVLTPSTAGVRVQSYNGASWTTPVVINSTALYVQEKGTRVRDLGYEFSSDKYTGNDLSIMSEHLFDGYTIDEMTYADEPYGVVWCVRSDGLLLGLTYQREHQVWGWHQHSTDGQFESAAVISEDGRDALYVTVKRVINGSVKRYVERLEPRVLDKAENSFFVDSGLSTLSSSITGATQADPVVITDVAHPYNNGDLIRITNVVGMTELNGNVYKVKNKTADTYELTDEGDVNIDGIGFTAYESGGTVFKVITTVTGLDHLEGKTVAVLSDGNVVKNLTVSSGSITLPRRAANIHIGLPYTPAIELLDIDTPSGETIKPNHVTVSRVTIEFKDSRGGWVGPKKDDGTIGTMYEIKPRYVGDGYDVLPLRTGKEEIIIDPIWTKGGGVRIEQREPLPMTILSVMPEFDVGD